LEKKNTAGVAARLYEWFRSLSPEELARFEKPLSSLSAADLAFLAEYKRQQEWAEEHGRAWTSADGLI